MSDGDAFCPKFVPSFLTADASLAHLLIMMTGVITMIIMIMMMIMVMITFMKTMTMMVMVV